MNYRDFFDKALSEAYTEAPVADDKKFVGTIYERAKGMSKKNENIRQMKFTEITPDNSEPKRSRKALSVFAGVAGTAAVLTGAVFGLKFIAENGGLKGPDVKGAGYQEDTGTAETATALIDSGNKAERKDILQSVGDVLDFGDTTITIEKVEFDGQFLRAEFSEEFHGDPADKPNRRIWLGETDSSRPVDFPYVFDIVDEADRSTHYTGRYVMLEPGQVTELRFGYASGVGDDPIEYLGYYTLTGQNTDGLYYKIFDGSSNTTVTVSPFGALISCPRNYAEDDNFSVSVKYRDGTETILADRDTKPRGAWGKTILYRDFYWNYTDTGMATTCLISLTADPINIADVAGVSINGEEVRSGKVTTAEIDAVGKAVNGVVPMDKTIELDGVTVHFTGYEFDSEVVTFYYDIIGTTRMDIRPMGINGAVYHSWSGDPDEENNMIRNCRGTVALYETADTARISFGKDLTDLTDKSYTTDVEAFAVTVHFDSDNVLKLDREDVYALFNDDFPDYAVWMTKLLVTPTHITQCIRSECGFTVDVMDYYRDNNARVIMNDGENAEAHLRNIITADDDSGIIWLTYYFDEPIDTAKVSEVYFDEYRLYGEEIPKLSAGDSFKLDDGATAHIDYMHYDGFIFKTQITVHSDDPDYSTNKMKAKMSADPDDHVFLITGVELVGETGVAFSTGSDDKGCDVVYTYFAVLPENGQFHTGRIWDESADRDRTVGYIEYGGITDETTGYTRTFHTESEEYGTRDVIISPYGFKMEQSGSDYYLESLHNQMIVVREDGTVWYTGYDAAGEDSRVDDRQMLFGAFDGVIDLNDAYSLTFCGETFVLDDAAEVRETNE